MSTILEVYYAAPVDVLREERIAATLGNSGGALSFHEEPSETVSGSVCLTFEFETREAAMLAASAIRLSGEHVEGPSDCA